MHSGHILEHFDATCYPSAPSPPPRHPGQDLNQSEVRMIEDNLPSYHVDWDMMWHCWGWGEEGGWGRGFCGWGWRRRRKLCLKGNRSWKLSWSSVHRGHICSAAPCMKRCVRGRVEERLSGCISQSVAMLHHGISAFKAISPPWRR